MRVVLSEAYQTKGTVLRILITGSRNWDDESALLRALCEYTQTPENDITVVHGGAKGADTCAHKAAETLGFHVETHPADWGKHGKAAGPIRNQEMVDTGADICLAFPLGKSVGTWDCVRRAKAAGIPVKIHNQ